MYGTARNTVYGYSLYDFRVYGTATGVAKEPSEQLMQGDGRATLDVIGYHNGMMQISLPVDGSYQLSAFTLDGRCLGQFVAGFGSAGMNRVSLKNQVLPQGMYVIRLASQGVQVTRKIQVVR
jgi:hypothetical protein